MNFTQQFLIYTVVLIYSAPMVGAHDTHYWYHENDTNCGIDLREFAPLENHLANESIISAEDYEENNRAFLRNETFIADASSPTMELITSHSQPNHNFVQKLSPEINLQEIKEILPNWLLRTPDEEKKAHIQRIIYKFKTNKSWNSISMRSGNAFYSLPAPLRRKLANYFLQRKHIANNGYHNMTKSSSENDDNKIAHDQWFIIKDILSPKLPYNGKYRKYLDKIIQKANSDLSWRIIVQDYRTQSFLSNIRKDEKNI